MGTFLIDEFISSYGRDSQLVFLPVVWNPMVKRLLNLIATLEDYLDIPIYIRVVRIRLHTHTTLLNFCANFHRSIATVFNRPFLRRICMSVTYYPASITQSAHHQ